MWMQRLRKFWRATRSEVFHPDSMDVVLGHEDRAAAVKKIGLELLAPSSH